MHARRRWLCSLLLVAAACDGDATEPPEASYDLVAAATTPSGPAGSRLLEVPLAIVRDAAGAAVGGVSVALTVESGAGITLPEPNAASGPDGIVRADVQLGGAGDAQIRVALTADAARAVTVPVTVSAAPALTSVAPTSFTAGDVVTLSGTGLPTEAGGATVLVGGVRATVLEATGGTTLRVRAPACVAAGTVPVAVSLAGGVATNSVNATYVSSAAAPSLQRYEAVTVAADRANACLSLLGAGARYLVVPQFATRDDVGSTFRNGARFGFTLGAPASGAVASLAAAVAAPALSPQARLDQALRRRERQLAPLGAAQGPHPALDAPPLAALTLNSTRTFRVLTDLNGDEFTDVTARLRYIGDEIVIYVDEAAPTNGFNAGQLEGLGNLFDRKLAPAAVQTFGSESDIDRNGHVVVLLTPQVNRLTSADDCTESGFVTGFFYGLDLLASQRNSNKAEVFYALVPDPTGIHSCRHSVDEILRLVPSTFIHEFQHMISWNQKVLVRGNTVDEELWLNEGLSHIAEEVASLLYENDPTQPRSTTEQIFPDSSQGFIVGNYVNGFLYLSKSTDVSLTLFNNDGSLEERGAAFLFLRWLGDQKGTEIYRRLVASRQLGVENVEDKAGEPFARLFADFTIAAYSADRLPGADPNAVPSRYRFLTRDLRRIWQRFYDTRTSSVTSAFPIQPVTLPPGGSAPARTMVPGTAAWYLLQTGVGTARTTVSMTLADPAQQATLGAQVSIFRIQ
jgi:hypothetical protein